MSKHTPVNCLLLGLLATACSREQEVRRYKETTFQATPAPAQNAPMAGAGKMMGGNVPTAALQLAWDTPAGWTATSGGSMRLATFTMEGAECSLSAFPGNTGGVEANLRRWLGQLDAEATDEQIAGLMQRATAFSAKGGWNGQAFDLTSALPDGTAKGMRAAILPVDGQSVFVKLMGAADVLEKQKAAFEALCKSLRMAEGASAPAVAETAPPPAARPMAGPMTGTVPTAKLDLAWKAPAGWTEKAGGSMRLATFSAGDAECSISAFPGDTGGEEANLRRWLGQLQITPTGDQLAKLAAGAVAFKTEAGWAGRLFDLSTVLPDGTASGMRAAIIPVEGQTVFVKLSGPLATLGAQAGALLQFCQSLHPKS